MLTGHRLVDDRDGRCMLPVGERQCPALEKRNPHHLQIPRRDDMLARHRRSRSLHVRLAFNFERETGRPAHQRQVAGGLDVLHSGKCPDPFQQLSVERPPPGVVAVSPFGRCDAGGDEAL